MHLLFSHPHALSGARVFPLEIHPVWGPPSIIPSERPWVVGTLLHHHCA